MDGSIYATDGRLSDYRADDSDPVPLLYQTGCLTIRGYEERSRRYRLGVPNGEVEYGLLQSLLPTYAPGYGESRGTDVFTLLDLVEAGDTEGIRREFEFAGAYETTRSRIFEEPRFRMGYWEERGRSAA